jgi:hypothetical protein
MWLLWTHLLLHALNLAANKVGNERYIWPMEKRTPNRGFIQNPTPSAEHRIRNPPEKRNAQST